MRKVLFVDVELVKIEEDDDEVNLVIVFFLDFKCFFLLHFQSIFGKIDLAVVDARFCAVLGSTDSILTSSFSPPAYAFIYTLVLSSLHNHS